MSTSRGKTIIIQGGQYGSEGKGQVAAKIAEQAGVAAAVRTGSINAGHTVHYQGKPYVMQIIPTAWVVPGVTLVLGAGCYIQPEVLEREVNLIKEASGEDVRRRLLIDRRCVWFGGVEQDRAKQANRHHSMGATGKGASEAIVSKIYDRGTNDPAWRLFINRTDDLFTPAYVFTDTVSFLNDLLEKGDDVLLEGTQGALLDFNTGPYPYVTSRMTNAAAWLAEAGLPPVNVETVLVIRSHPIRVAGNSGPLPGEISWPELAREVNLMAKTYNEGEVVPETAIVAFEEALAGAVQEYFPEIEADVTILPELRTKFHRWTQQQQLVHRVCVSEANRAALHRLSPEVLEQLRFFEKTTVTKKLRRIARFDLRDVQYAIQMNQPDYIVYTFLNYDFPHLANCTTSSVLVEPRVRDHLNKLQRTLGRQITWVTTGPRPEHQIFNPNEYVA